MKKMLAFFLVLTMLLSLPVTALADGDETENPAGATITLDKTQINLNQTSASALVATVTGAISDDYVIEWSIDNPDIIVMTPSTDAHHTQVAIKIKGGADGNGTITASIGEIKATCPVTVTLPEYVITFDSAGGTDVEKQTVKHRGYVKEPNPPTRTGYTFSGWYKHATKRISMYKWKFDSSYVEKNLTLYADWALNKYTVTFDKGNGTANESAVYEYNTAADAITKPNNPTRGGYTFSGWTPEITTVTGDVTYTAKWTPVNVTVGGNTYSLNNALEQVAEQTEIPVTEAVALDDAATLTVPAGGTVTVESKAADGAASAKEVTIKSGSTTETAYLVTMNGVTSAVKSNAVDNVITGKDESGNPITTAAEAKAHVAKMFDVPKTLAAIASAANSAVTDVDFSMKATEDATPKNGHTKTFEVHPVATDGTTEIEVPAEARIAKEYNVTLPFGAANKGKYAKITHYKSETETEVLGIYPIDASGNVTFPMTSFSGVGGDVMDTPEDGATFTLTVEAPESIGVDTEFEVEVKLTSSVDTQISTMKFSYSLPEKFTEVANSKTGYLAGAVKETESDWLWQAAQQDYIALTANTPLSLGTIKAKVAKADAEYNADKTFTFNAATLTLVNGANADGTAYKTYQTTAASDTTKVTTTYQITWDYNGGKLGNDTSKTDTVGVNVTPTAPAPVKPGYILSWSPTVANATADVTYTAVWTLNTSGMSVEFKDYGYAYVNSADSADSDKLLVLKASAPASGYAYAFDGKLMFATTEANYRALVSAADNETVYVYLVASATTSENVLGGATPKLSVVEGANETIARDGDLNRSDGATQGDLGVLVDLFKKPDIYTRDGVVGVRARLEADMNNEANAEAGFKSIADVNALIGKLFPASGG